MHAGEGQRPLRFDGHHAEDLHVGCRVDGLLEEGGLAGSRLATDDHRTAEPGPHAVQQLVERRLFRAVTDQSHGPTVDPSDGPGGVSVPASTAGPPCGSERGGGPSRGTEVFVDFGRPRPA